jgi:hypothetical protein
MSALDPVVTLIGLIKFEPPSGAVRLCDGGFAYFASEKYESVHPIFGTLAEPDEFVAAFGDMAEAGTLALIPAPGATGWFNPNLRNSRVRFWLGELDSDGKTVISAELMADMLVDTIDRLIGADGSVTLELGLIGRAEKLFLINEGNVCSERFHKTVWAGENGFNNCTDVQQPIAWGVASAPSGTSGFGSGGGARGGGSGAGGLFEQVQR